ncbi:molecular chaperone DnaJ [Colletotrichum orchidophilum]|uniref:Molecular chaperone DnaJ n=1 Tax=Colletotrichum orchidophilum TaxID=1209926 RepID=A0A1G4AUG6_9PEZI|nr:molecular chaperone DnaJ [Colletotrichum orchidophilum]OHE92798.1 molecular chaperone DnaJ [Colletotrichum orchidophilum]
MSALPPDPYKILGVSKDAQVTDIRSAYRKLVLKCHPDKVQDPTLKAQKQDEFQKVQQAYEILSDENERGKYDDNVRLAELRKEIGKGMSANTSAPRAPAARSYEVRTAEPRSDTYKTTYRGSPGGKPMYSTGYNSRSWDEEIHSRSNSIFDEPRARRAASYEKPSRQDDERERERERDRRRREERDREREDLARAADRKERERQDRERQERKAYEKAAKRAVEKAAAEKDERRQERKRLEKAEKEREKDRKRDAEEKLRRHKPAYIEEDESTYFAKSDKKKSSSTKEKEKDKRSRSIPRDGVPLREEPPAPPMPPVPADAKASKYNDTMLYAASYMDQSRKAVHPGLSRAQTAYEVRYSPPAAVPTPPAAAPFPPPPPPPMPTVEEDSSRRSKSRRSSETKTRDKSSHKKSSPTKEAPVPVPPSPNVVDASPSTRHMAQFASATSSPTSTSPPKHLGRSATFNDGYNRPPPGPVRAQTFSHVPAESADTRGRGRSRLQPQILSEDSDSEEDRHYQRSHRHRTQSPEAMSHEIGQRTRYMVNAGRTVPVAAEAAYPAMYRGDSPPRKHSKPTTYYDVRPSMPSREGSYSSSSPFFPKVKTARYDTVQYSDIPHRSRNEYTQAY